MRETIKRLLREEGLKKKFIKDILFKYWDKKGPSMKVGKYFSLSDSETADYLYEYYGDNVEDIVTEKVKSEIENYHSCGGNNFNLRFDNISFTTKEYRHYNVTFSLDYYSDVFNDFDSEDHENLMTLYGQIEECVENMLNDKLYDTYGIPVLHSLLNGVYDPNI
jgi:hypothetical protein